MLDAKNDGGKGLKIWREHYLSKGKPKIIFLYAELTSHRKGPEESVTDCMLRAERVSTLLKNANEVVSDSLRVAMILKGLPDDYHLFATVVTQRENLKWLSAAMRRQSVNVIFWRRKTL